jgi:1-phosphofructokinase
MSIHDPASDPGRICVLASSLLITVTIEEAADLTGDEIHIHPGGQGFWVARMIARLGERATVCAPIGGEAGRVLAALVPQPSLELRPVWLTDESAVFVHDRRSGERRLLAETPDRELHRHQIDDLFSATLETAIGAGICVVTGGDGKPRLPDSFYRRLANDLAATGVRVLGDLHGEDLDAFLEGGPLEVLKVSQEDLLSDGLIASGDEEEITAAISKLRTRGAAAVVVSGGKGPSLASIDDVWYRATQPGLAVADHRGSGDSMTAGLAVATLRGFGPEEMLRLGCAAGAANAVRRGLGNAEAGLIAELARMVEVEKLEGGGDGA